MVILCFVFSNTRMLCGSNSSNIVFVCFFIVLSLFILSSKTGIFYRSLSPNLLLLFIVVSFLFPKLVYYGFLSYLMSNSYLLRSLSLSYFLKLVSSALSYLTLLLIGLSLFFTKLVSSVFPCLHSYCYLSFPLNILF